MSEDDEPIGEWSDGPDFDTPAEHSVPSLVSRIRWGLVAFIVLAVAVIILAGQNTQVVELRALGWTATAPLAVIILTTVLVTVILDELVGLILRSRRHKRHAEKAELERLRRESS